ncbi:MAG: glycosyltransferase family 4 protein [Planctomycetaceae bacterium]
MAESVKRVLLMSYELAFRGSSVLTLRLAGGLRDRGVETVVLCCEKSALDAELSKDVRIVTVPGYTMPFWGRVVRRTVLHQLASQPPDIIQVVGIRLLPQAMWLGERLNCPVVLNITDQSEAGRIVLPPGPGPVRAIACVSDSVKVAMPARLNHIEQRVILPGVRHNPELEPPPILNDDRTPVIGMAGQLEVIKGGSFFLRACHRVLESGVRIRIVVTGSGPEERNLRRLATSLELNEHITFVDSGTAMSAYLSAVDIFCLPSLQQGFGIFLLEAMALSRPVIASGVGGVLSILEDSINGILVPPSDSRALAERMLFLLKNPDEARRLGAAGRQLVRDRFTVERMTTDALHLYHDVLQTSSSAASLPIPTVSSGERK